MGNKYRLERVEPDEKWDAFVQESDGSTLFSYSTYLNALNGCPALYFVYKNQELRAAVALMERDDGCDQAIQHDYVIYNGLFFGASTTGQNASQRLSEQFRVSEFVAEELVELYPDGTRISLAPSFIDLRPFLWVNYGTDKPKYEIDIRYTSFVDLSGFSSAIRLEDIKTYNHAAKARRQVIRYAKRDEVVTTEEYDVDLFVQLYESTMGRQEKEVAYESIAEMKNLIYSLYREKLGRMFVSRTADDVVGSMAFFGLDHHRAYYLFGANDPENRDQHTGTAVLWDAFKILADDGIMEVDLEGVNSPQRGWFKLSFGGDIRPYYQLSFNLQ